MTPPTTNSSSLATAVTALRQIGFRRIVLGYFIAEVALAFAADFVLGRNGLGVFPDGGGVGVAFGFLWAYITFQRLGRAEPLSRAIAGAFRPALLLTGAAVVLMILRRRF